MEDARAASGEELDLMGGVTEGIKGFRFGGNRLLPRTGKSRLVVPL